MKHKTNRLHFSTRTVAMLLSVIMLLSAIVSGSMLSTFAAYLDNAAKADAVTQAAAQGGDIALNAIPSEDNADHAEDMPDLSGFEENEIVRGLKQDLASTGDHYDLNTSETFLNIKFSASGSYEKKYVNSQKYADFKTAVDCTAYYKVVANLNYYGYVGDWGSSGYSSTNGTDYCYTGHNNGGPSDFTANLSAGEYVVKIDHVSDDWKACYYYFYKKPVYVFGNFDSPGDPGTGGSWDGSAHKDMIYNGSAYRYDVVGDGKEYRFRAAAEGHTYYPSQSSYDLTQKTSYDNSYGASDGTSDNYFYFVAHKGVTYHIWLQDGKLWMTETVNLKVYGEPNGESSWQSKDSDAAQVLTYSGTNGKYYYENDDASSVGNILYRFYDTQTGKYYKAGNSDVTFSGVGETNKLSMTEVNSDPSAGAFKLENTAGSLESYKIWVDFSGNTPYTWIEAELPEAAYYVANNQTLTGNSWDEDDPDGAMTLSSGTTWTKTFTGLNPASDSSQTYKFRIADGTECKTNNGDTLSGNAQPAFGTGDDEDNVIFTLGATDTSWTVTITYDSSDNAVTVNALEAEEVDDSGWLYSGVAAASRTTVDPTEGFTANSSNYFVWGDNEDSMGGNNKNAVPTLKNGNKYWIDLTSYLTAGNFDFAISAANTGNSRFGNASTNINENITSASDTTITDASGATLFKLQRREKNSRYNVLLYGVDSTKVTAIGVVADIGSCTNDNQQADAVNYKIYYKGVSTAPTKNQNFMVYAKDGTITETEYGFGKYADTTISDTKSTSYTRNENDAHDEDYYTGTFTLGKTDETGNTLTITTTVDETDRAKMYVKGWSVNGTTYGYNASDTVAADGVYTTTVKVTYEEFKNAPVNGTNKIIEITPIYYLVGAKTVSFRVENFDEEVQETGGWGSTLYAYPFYGALSNVANSFGAYPGQPLIYYNGKYSIQIPMESISLKDPDTDGTIVRGITLNNGYFDNAHKDAYGWTSTSQHKQTYDFDDFYKIYNEKKANDIIFRFKYRDTTKTYNRENYFSTSKTTLTATDITNLEADKGWELLRDRAGRIIDVFGNPILKNGSTTEYATETSQVANYATEVLHIVSMGYFDNNAGEYATEWVIFNNAGTRIQSGDNDDYKFSIVPSALLLNDNTRFATSVYKTYRDKPVGYYKDLYNVLNSTATAKGKPALIAYERDQERTNNAFRSDGRWYYTTSTDYVQSNIKIQYKTPAGTYVDDTYATADITDVTGVTTGAKAYFTNTKYENKRQSLSEVYSAAEKDNYTFEAVDGENYQFAGWFIEVDGNTDKPTYTPINPDADGNYAVARTSSDVLVARFDPIKAGTVKIAHTVTQGSGTAELKVEFGAGDSYTTLRDFGTSSYTVSSSYIKATNSSKNVKITLKTTAGTDHSFNTFDASDSTKAVNAYFPDATGTTVGSVTTKEIVIPVSTILANNTSSLTYYSLLNAPTYKYEITYQFTSTRLKTADDANATLTYTSKGDMTSNAYKKNVTIDGNTRKISSLFISDVAPHESNFKQILSYGAANIAYPGNGYVKDGDVYTQKATVTFVAQDDKSISGTISLPYQWKSTENAFYAASDTYIDYTDHEYYSTDEDFPFSTKDGILLDYSAEPIPIDTVYGGYFVAGDSKTSFDFYDENNQKYIIKAPDEILDSTETQITKYTIDNNGNGSWDYYGAEGSDAYEAEIKRILGIEGLEDNTANRAAVKARYTTPEGKKCYRVSTETHYIPNGEKLYFQYWSIQNTDQKEVARCYFTKLNYLAFEDYFITPIYGDEKLSTPDTTSATISYLGESRNQWNHDGGSTVKNGTPYGLMDSSDSVAADYIWEDFAVEFQYDGKQLNEYDGSEVTEMGVVIQKAGARVDGVTSSSAYRSLYRSTESVDDVKNYLKNEVLNDGSTYSGKYTKQTITQTNLNNKNREDYFLRIANSYGWDDTKEAPTHPDTRYSNSAMRVYSYIIIGDVVYVSKDPAYFCTYGIANA